MKLRPRTKARRKVGEKRPNSGIMKLEVFKVSNEVWREIYQRVNKKRESAEEMISEGSLTEDIENIRMETRIFLSRMLRDRRVAVDICSQPSDK